ncbi:MAG: hypothetical protein V2A77_10800 [Pseudomonadota bacterium]
MSTDSSTPIEGELIEPIGGTIALIERAEVDLQIATAHQYPRSMERFKAKATEMVTLDEETAASCIYRRPVGKDPDTGQATYAEGMSVRMAEIVGACYENLRVGAQIIQQTERSVRCRGVAHDLESNFASSTEVIESTVKRNGKPYDERMRVVVAKAALAKARRDATFQVVPRGLCKFLEAAARKLIAGDSLSMEQRRANAVTWIGKLSIDPKRVYAALGIGGPSDLGVEELTTLVGIRTALKEGDTTVDEAFPAPEVEKPDAGKSAAENLADRLKKAQQEKKPTDKAPDKPTDKAPPAPSDPPPQSAPGPESAPPPDGGPSESEVIEQQYHDLIDQAATLAAVLGIETEAAGNQKLGETEIKRVIDHCGQRRVQVKGGRGEGSNRGKAGGQKSFA